MGVAHGCMGVVRGCGAWVWCVCMCDACGVIGEVCVVLVVLPTCPG